MYNHIIVPFDGTESARRAANVGADLASTMGAELVLATASELPNEETRQALKEQAMLHSDAEVTVWLEPSRSPIAGVASVASFRPNSLICMFTHARTGVLRTVYGSLAESILSQLDAPVLLIGPEWAGASIINLHHLIVCLDGFPTSEAAIPLAGVWAEALALDVTLLHVHAADHERSVDLDRMAVPLEAICDIVDKVEVHNPNIVEGILDVVAHSMSPFVVMATSSRTGIDRLLHGSVLAELSAQCPVPILVQRGPLPTVHLDGVASATT